jgi:hypothetical protein
MQDGSIRCWLVDALVTRNVTDFAAIGVALLNPWLPQSSSGAG